METVLIFVINKDDGVHATNDVVTTNNDHLDEEEFVDLFDTFSEFGQLIAD